MKRFYFLLPALFLGLMGINAQTVVTGFSYDFNSPLSHEDSLFWMPNGSVYNGDTLVFTVMHDEVAPGNYALHIFLRQKNFFDGQMFLLKDTKGVILDATQNPLVSFKVKIDSADWQVMVGWDNGPVLGPSSTVPFQVSFWSKEVRLTSMAVDVPIDQQWHDYLFVLGNPDIDVSTIDQVLIESVSWPRANKAYYWFDDFKIGDAVAITKVSGISVDVVGGGDPAITVNEGVLDLTATIEPDNADVKKVAWKLLPGSGYAKITASTDNSATITAVSDGTVKVVALSVDGSDVKDTLELTLSNQIDTITTYTQNFNSNVDMNLWAPNGSKLDDGTPVFTVARESNALHVLMRQKNFFDGQMYDFKKWEGKVMNLSGKPLASVKIKVDSADWQVMVGWDNGPVLGPSSTVPFSISPFANGERLASYGNNVPIGGNWAEYFFSFFNPEADLTGIEQMLFESVNWPAANKAYYWMDDVKFGDAVTVPELVTDITVSSQSEADSVETKKSLQMMATVAPETATFTKVYWTVSDTAIASIDQDGKLTGKKVGVVTVTAWAIDGSGVHNSMDVRVYLPVSVRDLSTSPFRMYPNPASDYLHFANSGKIETVSLMSVSGQLIMKERMNGRNSLDVRNLEKGMYLIRIIDRSGKVYVGSFMKQ